MGRNRVVGAPYQPEVKTQSFTTEHWVDQYLVDAPLGEPVIITLDPTAVMGDQVAIQDVGGNAASQSIVINASDGQTIIGLGSSIAINTNGGGVLLTFDFNLGGWVPASFTAAAGTTPATVPTVTSADSPYQVIATDTLVKFDESNGSLATAKLPASPVVGERHTFKWWNWTGGSPPPVISGNGKQIEVWTNPLGAQGLSSSSTISTQGAQGTWEYDGTQWVLVGV